MEKTYYAIIVCTADSMPESVKDRKFNSQSEANAYAQGFMDAKDQAEMETTSGEFNPLEEYYSEVCTKENGFFKVAKKTQELILEERK